MIQSGIRNDPQIYLQRGICYENLEDWASALVEFSQCISLIPSYSKAYYHRGLCKIYTGDQSGVNDFDLAIKYDPKFFDAYITRATYHHSQENYVAAIEDCNIALMLEPTSIAAFLLRGTCRCKLDQSSKAITDFTSAVVLDKSSFTPFFNRATAQHLQGNLSSAIQDYSIVLLLTDDPVSIFDIVGLS